MYKIRSSCCNSFYLLWCLWLVAALLFLPTTTACRCVEPTLESSFENNEVAAVVWVRREVRSRRTNNEEEDVNRNRYYHAYVYEIYQGCNLQQTRRRRIIVRTANSSAACGVSNIRRRTYYLLFGYFELDVVPGRFRGNRRQQAILDINSCQYQKQWRELPRNEQRYLQDLPRLDCRSRECTRRECGPEPAAPNFLCPDGETLAGPSGECKYNRETGQCGWEFISCPTCDSDRDCDRAEQYCAGGRCRKHGTCRNWRDCFNPSNEYIIPKRCLFYLDCTNRGMCDGICGSSCPPGEDIVNCLVDPCDDRITQCEDSYTCVSDYCGGCNAYFFDTKGDPVCD